MRFRGYTNTTNLRISPQSAYFVPVKHGSIVSRGQIDQRQPVDRGIRLTAVTAVLRGATKFENTHTIARAIRVLHTQLASMSFHQVLCLTTGVYFGVIYIDSLTKHC